MELTRDQEIRVLRWLEACQGRVYWPESFRTVRTLSEHIGVPPSTVQKWTNNYRLVPLQTDGRSENALRCGRVRARLLELGEHPTLVAAAAEPAPEQAKELSSGLEGKLSREQEIEALYWLVAHHERKKWSSSRATSVVIALHVKAPWWVVEDWDNQWRFIPTSKDGAGNVRVRMDRVRERLHEIQKPSSESESEPEVCYCGSPPADHGLGGMEHDSPQDPAFAPAPPQRLCHCGQPTHPTCAVNCADCQQTVDDLFQAEITESLRATAPDRPIPIKPLDGLGRWLFRPVSTVDERWRLKMGETRERTALEWGLSRVR